MPPKRAKTASKSIISIIQVSKSTANAIDDTKTRSKSNISKQKKNIIKNYNKNYKSIDFEYLYASIIEYEGAEYQKRKKELNFIYFHCKYYRKEGYLCKGRIRISIL